MCVRLAISQTRSLPFFCMLSLCECVCVTIITVTFLWCAGSFYLFFSACFISRPYNKPFRTWNDVKLCGASSPYTRSLTLYLYLGRLKLNFIVCPPPVSNAIHCSFSVFCIHRHLPVLPHRAPCTIFSSARFSSAPGRFYKFPLTKSFSVIFVIFIYS